MKNRLRHLKVIKEQLKFNTYHFSLITSLSAVRWNRFYLQCNILSWFMKVALTHSWFIVPNLCRIYIKDEKYIEFIYRPWKQEFSTPQHISRKMKIFFPLLLTLIACLIFEDARNLYQSMQTGVQVTQERSSILPGTFWTFLLKP